MTNFITWIDTRPKDWRTKSFNQLFPVVVCLILFIFFVLSSVLFIKYLINPFSIDKIVFEFYFTHFLVGFFLYFFTAVDYALIVGRMQIANPGLKARFIMNVFTCVGCFVGVSLVLFLWGFAKEVDWLIIALLIFAGSVMIKLAYEGLEYFQHSTSIWKPLRMATTQITTVLHNLTQDLTFWIPEIGSPSVTKLTLSQLASWSFLLPFLIGFDDFIGYMGAMTIYNVYSLLIGIFLADIVIDLFIFISPSFTKRMVESPLLSLFATYAFLYLTYKSFSEAIYLIAHSPDHVFKLIYLVSLTCLIAYLLGRFLHRHVISAKLKRRRVSTSNSR